MTSIVDCAEWAAMSEVNAVAWSHDGKKIAVTRSRFADTDVVMFSGLR
jgi:hypothetical protein